MSANITRSNEDYLEAILMIRREIGHCRAVDVAMRLNVSKPSVSVAMANLEKMSLVTVDNDHDLKLTRTGMRHARRVLERHELISAMLAEIGVPEDIASQDACRIEHDISQESFERLRAWYENRVCKEEGQV